MSKAIYWGVGLVLGLLTTFGPVRANHIIGGHLSMVNVDNTPGKFRLSLIYYYNEPNPQAHPVAPSLQYAIFRKRDQQLIETGRMTTNNVGSRPPVPIDPTCAPDPRVLAWTIVTYEHTVQLDPSRYTDAQGYYVVVQTCCRNDNIANITYPPLPDRAGFGFYLEFPALRNGNAPFTNSSPKFTTPTVRQNCINQPIRFSATAEDADGDELRYSLVTPLKGDVTSTSNADRITPNVMEMPIAFRAGFSASSPLPTSGGFALNAQTGQLVFTPTQPGVYIFTVRVEEYRAGRKIGEVRNDYQFSIIDCPSPTANANIRDKPPTDTEATICNNEVWLQASQTSTDWTYQWQYKPENGSAFEDFTGVGGNTAEMRALLPGTYRLVTSFRTGCGQPRISREITVRLGGGQTYRLTAPAKTQFCPGANPPETIRLEAENVANATYEWLRNDVVIDGATARTFDATQPGNYVVRIQVGTGGCAGRTNSVALSVASVPNVALQSAGNSTVICAGQPLALTASGATTYEWRRNGVVLANVTGERYAATDEGEYIVTGKDANGCTAVSSPINLARQDGIAVAFAPVPPQCNSAGPVALSATPAGGAFAGPGVSGSQFDPRMAGPGQHTLTYTVTGANVCQSGQVRQQVLVAQPPAVELPATVYANLGQTVVLEPVVAGTGSWQFAWNPTFGITDPTRPRAEVRNLTDNATYTLQVIDAVSGCRTERSVEVIIRAGVWIPTAFSPNNDAINDTWEIKGLDRHPDARVTVYSRWGEVVYHNADGYRQPFDGTYQATPLPAGTYHYVIRLSPTDNPLRGNVTLIR